MCVFDGMLLPTCYPIELRCTAVGTLLALTFIRRCLVDNVNVSVHVPTLTCFTAEADTWRNWTDSLRTDIIYSLLHLISAGYV